MAIGADEPLPTIAIEVPTPGRRPEDCPVWVAVAVLALLSAACCTPLLDAGWFVSHEELRPIARALAAYHEIAGGDLYPRWLSTGYLGKGVPLFNFYPPAFSLLVAYGHALGVPLLLAGKLTIFLLFFAGGLGATLWARPHLGSFPALVAGILYLFAPYHFVDIYVRGATAEFTSLAALPYLFLAIDRSVDRLSARALASLALASAAIVVSHFLSALMIAPFAAVYALARALPSGGRWMALGRIVAGVALGAALSAFFWLPALVERNALSSERGEQVIGGYYTYFLHFVHPKQWLDRSWQFGNSVAGYADGMSFQVGLPILISAAASALLVWRLPKPARGFVLLTALLGIAALWLTSPSARVWYAWLPPFQLIQFPWRYLGPVTLFLAAAGGGVVRVLAEWNSWLGPGSTIVLAALALGLSSEQRTVRGRIPVADDRAAIERVVADAPWSTKFGNEDEFLPKHADVEAASRVPGGPNPGGVDVEISNVRGTLKDLTFEVASPADRGIAVIPWYAFPGWEVSLDGREWQFVPRPDGLLAFRVPQGRHLARVHFATTPPRVAGWLLASAALLTLGALVFRERRAEP
jgi:hypothetical protein